MRTVFLGLGAILSVWALIAAVREMLMLHSSGVPFRAREMRTYFSLLSGALIVPSIVLLNPVAPLAAGIVSLVLAVVTAIFFIWS